MVRGSVGLGGGHTCGALRLSVLLCSPIGLLSRMARAISLVSRRLEVWESEWEGEA